jgi:hypothetical protein
VHRAAGLGGEISAGPLADDSASRIVKRYASRAAESGASIWKLSEVAGNADNGRDGGDPSTGGEVGQEAAR